MNFAGIVVAPVVSGLILAASTTGNRKTVVPMERCNKALLDEVGR